MINLGKAVLTVEKLGIRRSERWLFRHLDFTLMAGETIQVVGENGAGKTSLLRSLCGLLSHAEGEIRWCEVNEQPCLPLYLGHLPAVKPELTVFENLKYHPVGTRFYPDEKIEAAIEQVRLGDYLETPARYLSAGQTRRVGLARLLLAETTCWILDEPFTSLDKEGCRWLQQQIGGFTAGGGAVMLTSHQAVDLKESPRIVALDSPPENLC